MADFSVLLPVYLGDRPDFFERALRSVGADQTLQPSEILVVCDGPVKPGVDAVLTQCAAGERPDLIGQATIRVHRLEHNQGLTAALNAGLAVCTHDIVARADADDIALPHRFATQIPLMDQFDLVGSSVLEFSDDENETGLLRAMPLTSAEIRQTVTYRDPFNHPTVVYRRQAVLAVGGYEHVNCMEDYLLFARMVAVGTSCCNVPDALVKYRVGAGAYARRGGRGMLVSELTLQNHLRREGIVTIPQYLRNIAVRGGYRLIPTSVRKVLYRAVGQLAWFRKR